MTPSPPAPSSADPVKIREKKENAPRRSLFLHLPPNGASPRARAGAGCPHPAVMVRVGNGGASRRRPTDFLRAGATGAMWASPPTERLTIDVCRGRPPGRPAPVLHRTLPAGHMGPALQEYCASRAGRTESSAPTNRSVGAGVPDGPLSPAAMLSVGRGALTPPPGLVPHFHVKSLSLQGQCAHWLWRSVLPGPCARVLRIPTLLRSSE